MSLFCVDSTRQTLSWTLQWNWRTGRAENLEGQNYQWGPKGLKQSSSLVFGKERANPSLSHNVMTHGWDRPGTVENCLCCLVNSQESSRILHQEPNYFAQNVVGIPFFPRISACFFDWWSYWRYTNFQLQRTILVTLLVLTTEYWIFKWGEPKVSVACDWPKSWETREPARLCPVLCGCLQHRFCRVKLIFLSEQSHVSPRMCENVPIIRGSRRRRCVW